MIREDQVTVIKYQDNQQITMHKEGTKMHISADKSSILVESPMYSPIRISFNEGQECIVGEQDWELGRDNLIDRAYDGKIIETFLVDGTVMRTFYQKCTSGVEEVINLLYGDELIKTTNLGEIVICDQAGVLLEEDSDELTVQSLNRKQSDKIAQGSDIRS